MNYFQTGFHEKIYQPFSSLHKIFLDLSKNLHPEKTFNVIFAWAKELK